MSNSDSGASRPNIFLIGLLAVAVAGAALFFVLRKPVAPPAPPQTSAATPVPPPAVATLPATPPAPVVAPAPPPPPPKVVLTIPAIEWPGKVFSARLKDLKITNSSLPAGEIEALLKGGSPAAMAETLAKFNADDFSIGSLEVESTIEDQKSTTIYETISGKSIVSGVIGRIEVASIRQKGVVPDAADKPIAYEMNAGVTSIEALDFVTGLRWFIDSDPAGNAPLKPVHGTYIVEKTEFSGQNFKVEIGRTAMGATRVKPPRRAMSEMWPNLEALMKQSKADTPEFSFGALADLLDVYSSFELGDIQVGPISGSGKTDAGLEGAFKSGGMRLIGGSKASAVMEPLDVSFTNGNVKLGGMSWQGDFYKLIFVLLGKTMLESEDIKTQPEADVARLKAELARHTVPDIGFKVSTLDVDVPNTGKQGERVKFSLGEFESRNAAFVGMSPTDIGFKVVNFRMPIPADSKDKSLQMLRALGIETLDASFNLDGIWDEAKSTVTFKDISSSVEKFGALAMSFDLGNVPKSLFENPVENWSQVLLGGTATRASLSLGNRGGFEKLLENLAAEQGKTAERLRLEVSTMAPALLAAFFASHPDAVNVTEAVGGFLRGLNEFSLKARAEGADGLRLLELAGAGSNPAALIRKLRFEASGK
ncbi:MAG: hypothetical protein ACRDBL_14905 [Rhabdaerophilum sp.]